MLARRTCLGACGGHFSRLGRLRTIRLGCRLVSAPMKGSGSATSRIHLGMPRRGASRWSWQSHLFAAGSPTGLTVTGYLLPPDGEAGLESGRTAARPRTRSLATHRFAITLDPFFPAAIFFATVAFTLLAGLVRTLELLWPTAFNRWSGRGAT